MDVSYDVKRRKESYALSLGGCQILDGCVTGFSGIWLISKASSFPSIGRITSFEVITTCMLQQPQWHIGGH